MTETREILFRGKRVDNGEWVEGFYINLGGQYHYILSGKLDLTKGFPDFEKYQVDPATVSQYIEINDASGYGIFEGDIVKIPSFTPSIMAIGFIEGAFCFVDKSGEFLADIHYIHHAGVNESEVIGNRWDNPELLENAEQ